MTKRTHICDITLNATRASVFHVADKGTVRHEVELCTNISNGGQFARFDFHDCLRDNGRRD
jgi:hypothetical protein